MTAGQARDICELGIADLAVHANHELLVFLRRRTVGVGVEASARLMPTVRYRHWSCIVFRQDVGCSRNERPHDMVAVVLKALKIIYMTN